jgi:hypothetical protein
VSPDEDFSPTGSNSGIKYSESFQKYKDMIIRDSGTVVFKRIISEFNNSLFGSVTATRNDLIAEDGNYDSELERFMA